LPQAPPLTVIPKEDEMVDPRIRKWAEVLAQYSAPVKPGDEVVITATTLAEPLVLELYRAVLQREGLPRVIMTSPSQLEYLFRYAPDSVLDSVSDLERHSAERLDVGFHILSENNTRALTEVDPDKVARWRRAYRPLAEIESNRAAAGEFLWSLTLYPTPAYAQDAEMSLLDYSEFIFEACFLNDEDPIGRWQELSRRQQVLVDRLNQAHEIHLRAPGTDLHLGIAGRRWVNSDGTHNFPSGEVFTGPVEDRVEGHITFTFPAVYAAREVRGVQLWFEQGRVVKATAEHNEGFLHKTLDTDEGARFLGEIAFGTNYNIQRFVRNTLFDEKIGGTVHLALGNSYPETGGTNKSAIHWDLVCDLRNESEVYVDGELYQQNGRFLSLEGGIV
jgi:aminopeptidase